MIDPARLLTLAEEMAARAGEDASYSALAVLASHGALEALVNRLGGEGIASFNYRARFLPQGDRPAGGRRPWPPPRPAEVARASRFATIIPASQNRCRYPRSVYFHAVRL